MNQRKVKHDENYFLNTKYLQVNNEYNALNLIISGNSFKQGYAMSILLTSVVNLRNITPLGEI